MGLATFSIYKYVRTSKGWRYCKLVQGKNNRLKPDAVLVDGHAEGAYYLNVDGQWEKVGTSAAAAQDEQRKRLARQRYERETGERLPEPEPQGELLPGGHRRLPRGARNKGGHRGAFDAK